jgi:hypothetical protein
MFPLYQEKFPQTTLGLVETVTASLRAALQIPGNPVLIREIRYPDLAEITIDLSGSQLRTNAPRPSLPAGSGTPALTARQFTLKALPLSIGDASLYLTVDANGVVLHRNRDDAGNLFLQLQRADNGRVALGMRKRDLEILIDKVAKTEAGKQGVAIEHLQLNLTSRDSRSIGVEVRVQARKLFIRALVRIAGVLKIDEELVARISNLTCTGDGAIATVACGVLAPHLQALQNSSFPLLALPLGEAKLHDINLSVTDGIEATAEFGAMPA